MLNTKNRVSSCSWTWIVSSILDSQKPKKKKHIKAIQIFLNFVIRNSIVVYLILCWLFMLVFSTSLWFVNLVSVDFFLFYDNFAEI